MKIIEHDGGLLSNVEVLHVLRDREADKQAVISKALPSEIKVYQNLLQQTPTKKSVEELKPFLAAVKEFKLEKLEQLQLLNHCPRTPLELFQCIPECDQRFPEEDQDRLLRLVAEHLLQSRSGKGA